MTIRCSFFDYSERSKGFNFYVSSIRIFQDGKYKIIEEFEFVEGDKVINIVVEEEFVNILFIAIDNGQVLIQNGHDIITIDNGQYNIQDGQNVIQIANLNY